MSQRNDYGLVAKRPQTIDMPDPKVVDALDSLSKDEGLSRRKYLHNHLKLHVEKVQFTKSYFKTLKKITLEDGKLFVWDSNRRQTTEIGLKKGVVFCNLCESDNCVHVLFTMTQDELPQLEEFGNHTKKPKLQIQDYTIFKTKIKLEVKNEKNPIIMEIEPSDDGNILICNHCDNPDCLYRSHVLENKEFWEFLKTHGVKARRVRD